MAFQGCRTACEFLFYFFFFSFATEPYICCGACASFFTPKIFTGFGIVAEIILPPRLIAAKETFHGTTKNGLVNGC